jgi:hypothetical protein
MRLFGGIVLLVRSEGEPLGRREDEIRLEADLAFEKYRHDASASRHRVRAINGLLLS